MSKEVPQQNFLGVSRPQGSVAAESRRHEDNGSTVSERGSTVSGSTVTSIPPLVGTSSVSGSTEGPVSTIHNKNTGSVPTTEEGSWGQGGQSYNRKRHSHKKRRTKRRHHKKRQTKRRR